MNNVSIKDPKVNVAKTNDISLLPSFSSDREQYLAQSNASIEVELTGTNQEDPFPQELKNYLADNIRSYLPEDWNKPIYIEVDTDTGNASIYVGTNQDPLVTQVIIPHEKPEGYAQRNSGYLTEILNLIQSQ
jgi:hypothetical protein